MSTSSPKGQTLREERPAREPEAVRVWLLGGFRVSVGPRTVEGGAWRLRKAAALIKLLALAPGHRLHREQAMDALWPDLDRKAATNNLRQALHAARKGLDSVQGSRYLASGSESLVLNPGGELWVDAEAFENAAMTARRAKEPATYRAALDLYAGDLLPEDRYEAWAEDRRNELRHLCLGLLVELAAIHEERGELELAIEALREATGKEPTLEEAHLGLMRLCALSGRRELAYAQFERLRDALQGLGMEPSSAARSLREDIAAGRLPSTSPVDLIQMEPSDGAKHNLPASTTSFVGRERETVEIKRALSMTRLLTLTGAGGSGKTRLSLEIARDLVGSYPDGVWLVELAPLSDNGLVSQEVANVLGVQERPGEPLSDTLAEALAAKQMLLVIDNCEHIVEEAARLVDKLLASCPRLKVLATSREPLGVSGEVNWAVPPLSLPDATNGKATVDALVRYEAVRLFVDRARLRLLDFGITQENAQAVARVCRKLEGIPLAIELATARMGVLAVDQVAQRLEVSLDVLKGTSRSVAPRQQTLRATLDWSHDLLSEEERTLFGRLSVFAGGWTLEAAEAVCSGDAIGRDEVLDLLGGLVDKSLVVAGANTGGTRRYRMLEPIRRYAVEKVEESGDVCEVKGRHAAFLLALAEANTNMMRGYEEATWLERLEAERDNTRAILSWTVEREDADLGLRLAGALGRFWQMRGYSNEARRWLEEAVAKRGWTSPTIRAKALEALSQEALSQNDVDRAEEAAIEGLDLCDKAGIEGSRVAALHGVLGYVASTRGDSQRAKELFEEELRLYRRTGDKWGVAGSLNALALVWDNLGNVARAKEFYEEALVLGRELLGKELGDVSPLISSLVDLGYVLLLEGNIERAEALNEEAAVLTREHGHRASLSYALDNLGWTALLRGDRESSEALHKESLILCNEYGNRYVASGNLDGLACAAGARGDPKRAARLFGAARTLLEMVGGHLAPAEQALLEPYLTDVRSRLDEESWEAAFAEGQAMTFEEAVEYALSDEEITTPVQAQDQPLAPEQPPALTQREQEVAELIARGLTNRRIAEELFLSERTVHRHVSSVLKKLGVASREQVADETHKV